MGLAGEDAVWAAAHDPGTTTGYRVVCADTRTLVEASRRGTEWLASHAKAFFTAGTLEELELKAEALGIGPGWKGAVKALEEHDAKGGGVRR